VGARGTRPGGWAGAGEHWWWPDRGGGSLAVGSRLSLNSAAVDAVGMNPFVLGAARLLLQDGSWCSNWDTRRIRAAFNSRGRRARCRQRRGVSSGCSTVQGEGPHAGQPCRKTRRMLRQDRAAGMPSISNGAWLHWLDRSVGAMTVFGPGVPPPPRFTGLWSGATGCRRRLFPTPEPKPHAEGTDRSPESAAAGLLSWAPGPPWPASRGFDASDLVERGCERWC